MNTPHIDIRIPLTATEKQFLQLAVQAAAKKFREAQAGPSRLVQLSSSQEFPLSEQTVEKR